METRDWVRDGVRAVAGGVLAIALSVANIPLFVLFVVALLLTPVWGIGLVVLPLVTALIRARADLARRLAGGFGVPVARPYRPRPENAMPAGWRR